MEAGLEIIVCCTCNEMLAVKRPANSNVSLKCTKCGKLHRIKLEQDNE